MSLHEEEEPLTLPDSPRFRVFDENSSSLLGRLLNPDCQPMAKMIEYMPIAWRVQGRVRGIALSRDRFQFIFKREEDLQTVLNDRPWSYNHWAMVIERWTPDPPDDFLRYMDIWVRIRHIPVNFFTLDTMYALAKETGTVVEIAYDPKISHTKDYVRALVSFDTEKPAKASRKLTVKKGVTVNIEFEYERIHKRCYHCLCITHEKPKCPALRKGLKSIKEVPPVVEPTQQIPMERDENNQRSVPEDGPPGFPLLFPELPPQEQRMAMLYVSHSDDTERRARIQRVKQSIADQGKSHVATLTRLTPDLDKGKGHVFTYPDLDPTERKSNFPRDSFSEPPQLQVQLGDEESFSSLPTKNGGPNSAISTGFQVGTSNVLPAGGSGGGGKKARRRPPSWKRKVQAGKKSLDTLAALSTPKENGGKRKPDPLSLSPAKKLSVPSTVSVASILKPLLPQ